jgi:hypothetical protein
VNILELYREKDIKNKTMFVYVEEQSREERGEGRKQSRKFRVYCS